MTESALRSYIATTAAIVDNTDAPGVHAIQNGEWLVGGLGDDTVVGDATPDVLMGGGGSDVIVGGAGHDIIDGDDEYEPGLRTATDGLTTVTATRNWGGHPHEVYYSAVGYTNLARVVGAADVIYAGSGDDFVSAQYGDDTVHGDTGDDTIAGDAGDDALFGGSGNDRIAGDWYGTNDTLEPFGDDYLDGGDGDDILSGEAGADILVGGAGNDRLRGFIGVTFTDAPNENPADDGADHLSGGAGDDELIGDGGDDTLLGGEGNDQLFGDSDQTAIALHGRDRLEGGGGNDYLRGYGGDDELLGGAGRDTLHGDAGNDRLQAGLDDDVAFGMDGDDFLEGDAGKDQLVGGAGNDKLDGGLDADLLWGEAGNDTLRGGAGTDFLDGGDGDDLLYADAGGGTTTGGAGADKLVGGIDADDLIGGLGNDVIEGAEGDDALRGEGDDDALSGGQGNDLLVGGVGTDTLDGGEGEDRIYGDEGDDALQGGAGFDHLSGGAGNDVYLVDRGSGMDVILDGQGQDTIRFADDILAEQVTFRRGIDDLGNANYLVAEVAGSATRVAVHNGMSGALQRFEFADGTSIAAADAITRANASALPARAVPAPAAMVMRGSGGDDRIEGLASDDSIQAGAGADVLTGGAGRDRLDAGAGADRLDGGGDDDVLLGGDGTDVYVFGRGQGRDTIEEHRLLVSGAQAETDLIELSAGVLPTDVTLHRDGDDLVLAIGQTQAQLRVRSHFAATEAALNPLTGLVEQVPADHRIEAIRFGDGTVWNEATILAKTVAGTPNTMTGTAAADTFTVDDAKDVVNEAAGGGDDTIRSTVSFALPRNVERLTLTGFLDASVWSTPGNAVSYLTGNAGNNTFNGPGTYVAADGTRVSSLSGGVMGYAVMAGGPGDDTYHLRDTVGGQVVEAAGAGRDTVILSGPNWTSYQLPDHVEVLRSDEGGVGALGGVRYRIGNALDNTIEGSRVASVAVGVANVIDGGAGADTLIGFSANDRYVVDNAGTG